MPRISQRDVANACGVDQKTVSRVFLDPTTVTQSTRERVLAAAGRIGYMVVRPAQRTHGRRPVVLLEDPNRFRSTLDSRALRALSTTLSGAGVDLVHLTLPDEAFHDARALLGRLRHHAARALILNYHGKVPSGLDGHLARIGLPAVWLNQRRESSCVYPDDAAGAHLLTSRLLAMGHRRITYLQTIWPNHQSIGDHYSVSDRRSGYRQMMREAGLEPHVIDLVGSDGLPQSGEHERARYAALLDHRDHATAFLSYSSEASTLGSALTQRKLSCPGDCSLGLVGANSPVNAWWLFSGTCVDWEELGRNAAKLALEAAADPSQPVPAIAVPHVWVDGETLGPPRIDRRRR